MPWMALEALAWKRWFLMIALVTFEDIFLRQGFLTKEEGAALVVARSQLSSTLLSDLLELGLLFMEEKLLLR